MRLRFLPGCILAVLALAAPRVAVAEPPEAAPVPADPQTTPDAAPSDAGVSAEATADPGDAAPSDPTPESPPEAASEDGQAEAGPEDDQPEAGEDEIDPPESDEDDAGEEALDADASTSLDVPERLPRLQRIGWGHVLATFALGTTAGVLAGLAEREEDRAFRLASEYQPSSGGAPLYADRKSRYERILDRGQAFETSAIVVGALAGATAIAAITLFAVDARRPAPTATARRTRFGLGSVEVTF